MRPNINIRFANNNEGNTIRDLVVAGSDNWKELNWEVVNPWWLVAETERDGICACVQLLVGFPTSAIEFLAFKQGLPHTLKALITKRLATAGLAALKQAGASAVFGTVPYEMKNWKKLLKKQWNGTILTSGNLFFKRLQ